MNNENDEMYVLETSEGVYTYAPNPENPDNIIVRSTERLMDILLSSLELAGVEDGRYFEDYEIFQTEEDSYEFFLELTKVDFCLFFNFEVLNYV